VPPVGPSPDHPIGSCTACSHNPFLVRCSINHRAGAVPVCQDCHVKTCRRFTRVTTAPPVTTRTPGWAAFRPRGGWTGRLPGMPRIESTPQRTLGSNAPLLRGEYPVVPRPLSQPGRRPRPKRLLPVAEGGSPSTPGIRPARTWTVRAATRAQACGHFQGQCSDCHSAGTAWKPATFIIRAASDCQGMPYAHVRPADHYSGQCSPCHTAGTAGSRQPSITRVRG